MSGRVINSIFYQTIIVKCLPCTNNLPARLKGRTSGGHCIRTISRTSEPIPFNEEITQFFEYMLKEAGWFDEHYEDIVIGSYDNDTFVGVFLPRKRDKR